MMLYFHIKKFKVFRFTFFIVELLFVNIRQVVSTHWQEQWLTMHTTFTSLANYLRIMICKCSRPKTLVGYSVS